MKKQIIITKYDDKLVIENVKTPFISKLRNLIFFWKLEDHIFYFDKSYSSFTREKL